MIFLKLKNRETYFVWSFIEVGIFLMGMIADNIVMKRGFKFEVQDLIRRIPD